MSATIPFVRAACAAALLVTTLAGEPKPATALSTGSLNGASNRTAWPFPSFVPDPPPPAANQKPHPPMVAALPRVVPQLPIPLTNPTLPPNVYYLLKYTSVETPDGLIGFKPGTRLTRRTDGLYESEGIPLSLGEQEVTRELDTARRYANADALAQDSVLRAAAEPKPADDGMELRDGSPVVGFSDYPQMFGSTTDQVRAAFIMRYFAAHPHERFSPDRFRYFSPETQYSILLTRPQLLPRRVP